MLNPINFLKLKKLGNKLVDYKMNPQIITQTFVRRSRGEDQTFTLGKITFEDHQLKEALTNSFRRRVRKNTLLNLRNKTVEIELFKDEKEISRTEEYDIIYREEGKRPFKLCIAGCYLTLT